MRRARVWRDASLGMKSLSSRLWCRRRSTISATIRRNTSFAIASRSCGFSVWNWRIRFPTPRLCGSIARRWGFDLFDGFLKDKGYLAMGGQIIDATLVSAPKQHNSGEENETIQEGETPEDWKSKPAKNRQKDKDARWTKKHERSYFGYKNHIGVDRRHKFARRYVVSDASVHDSQKFEDVLDASQHGFGRAGRQRLSQR